jgi:hypothetical protein
LEFNLIFQVELIVLCQSIPGERTVLIKIKHFETKKLRALKKCETSLHSMLAFLKKKN